MKASEMINLLKVLKEKHGDFEISICNGDEPREYIDKLESRAETQKNTFPVFEFDGSKAIKGGTTCR